MTEHKSFANMVKYNLSALLLAVESGHGGWEDNVAEFVRQGGLKILKEIIEIHSKKGNVEILNMATEVLRCCTSHPEERKAFTAKVLDKKGGVKILKAAQTAPELKESVGNIMTVLEHCADTNGKLMANIDRYNACDGTFEALLGVIDAQANRPDVLQVAGSVLNKIAGKFLEAYLKALVKGDMENDERDRILRIVAALALDPRNARIINNYDGALPAILALLAKQAGVVESVLPCIAQIVERCATTDDASWNLIQLGAVEALVKAMRKNAPNKPFQISACRALAKLATSGRAVDALSSRGGVAEVVSTLQRDAAHHDVALASIDFVNNVASVPRLGDDELKALVAKLNGAGAVEGILSALDAPPLEAGMQANREDPVLAAAAMKALAFLGASSEDAHKKCIAGGAIDYAVYVVLRSTSFVLCCCLSFCPSVWSATNDLAALELRRRCSPVHPRPSLSRARTHARTRARPPLQRQPRRRGAE